MQRQIPWEQVSIDGDIVTLYEFKKRRHTAPGLRDLAVQKLTDVAAISAEFKGDRILYLPRFWVLFDYDSTIEFYGAYLPDEPDDAIPNLCIRRGTWSRSQDKEQVIHNRDYDEYVLSAKNAAVSVFFTNAAWFPQIRKLICEFAHDLTTRTHLELLPNLQPEEADCFYLQVKLYDEYLVFHIEYYPASYRRDKSLEERIELGRKCCSEISFETSITPDKGSCKLNYFPSVLERLATYISPAKLG